MKESRSPRGSGSWKAHLSEWKSSGLSLEEYCEREGLSVKCFNYQHERSQGKPKKSAFHFIEAKVAKSAVKPTSGLKIHLPHGVMIAIEGEVSTALLQMVLSTAGLPC